MRTPPADLATADLASVLAGQWRLEVADLTYAPVGFGSHHWWLTEPSGARWFVTVDEVDDAARAQLLAAMSTARALHEAGLEFVVAPRPATDGEVLHRAGGRHAVAVFPHVDGSPWPSSQESSEQDRAAVVDVLARLHAARPPVGSLAGADDLAVTDRAALEAALQRLAEPWAGGPFAEPARALLTAHAADLQELLARHDQLAAAIRATDVPWVVTHGEPKADNFLATGSGPVLVDWDTTLVAPAARDLWMVGSQDSDEVRRYRDLTGRDVGADELAYYRLRWDLADTAAYIAWFAAPHQRTADTEVGWAALQEVLPSLRRHLSGPGGPRPPRAG